MFDKGLLENLKGKKRDGEMGKHKLNEMGALKSFMFLFAPHHPLFK